MKKYGIRSNTEYTRAYKGVLIRDYGWVKIFEKLRRYVKFPNLILDDRPLRAPKDKELGKSHRLIIYLKGRRYVIDARYDVLDKKWYFYDARTGNSINILKLLRKGRW